MILVFEAGLARAAGRNLRASGSHNRHLPNSSSSSASEGGTRTFLKEGPGLGVELVDRLGPHHAWFEIERLPASTQHRLGHAQRLDPLARRPVGDGDRALGQGVFRLILGDADGTLQRCSSANPFNVGSKPRAPLAHMAIEQPNETARNWLLLAPPQARKIFNRHKLQAGL